MSTFSELAAYPGESLDEFCARFASFGRGWGIFNGQKLRWSPFSSDIKAQFNQAISERREGWRSSDEFAEIEAARVAFDDLQREAIARYERRTGKKVVYG